MKPIRAKTPARTPGGARYQRLGSNNGETDEVAVFCRLKPLGGSSDSSAASSESEDRCVQVLDNETLQLVPLESSRAFFNGKAAQYTFKAVFDEDSTQQSVFRKCGLPLVRDLLQGKNGLLFTYGVTGSGKTYTMQGSPVDGGLMTRSIDVIFNSIENRQTSRKYIVESDKLNDFQIHSSAEAVSRRQRELLNDIRSNKVYTRNNTSDPNISGRLPDDTRVDLMDRNCVYAVFISYYEIYNKYIYDLLDDVRDPVTGRPKFESKTLREDAHGSMFVYGCTEKEVRNSNEALELFYRGQKRRRVAETELNMESSRSHSIFSIRLVCCHPSDEDEVDASKSCLVSQLFLVDLAGSERTSRTGNTGDRLREAGNINNSLMNLRACIERLRDNQKTGKAGNVPYRNDKLTHLFRNYFEGIGSVKMIVNVNPRATDYEENVNVLQFSEMTQEVEIERHDPVLRELAMTPARLRVQQAYQEALNKAETNVDTANLNPVYCPIYSLGPAWPSMEWRGFEDEETLPGLLRYLDQRVATRNTLTQDHKEKLELFRQRLVTMEKDLIVMTEENKQLKVGWEGEKRRTRDLETRLVDAEAANTSLQRRAEAFSQVKVVLENELDEKELELNNQKRDAKREVRRLRSHLSSENVPAKRGYDDEEELTTEFKDVGSRIAEWRAKCGPSTLGSKKFKK